MSTGLVKQCISVSLNSHAVPYKPLVILAEQCVFSRLYCILTNTNKEARTVSIISRHVDYLGF